MRLIRRLPAVPPGRFRSPWLGMLVAGALALSPHASAQASTITAARVQEALAWLCDDARGGRDTPSAGLEAAADWLAARFAAAGLQQVVPESWCHTYTLPGLELDSRKLTVKLMLTNGDDKRELDFVANDEVRLWRSADVVGGDTEACTVARIDDPVLQRLLQAESGRRPFVIEVPKDHPYWLQSAGQRQMLGARRAAARPVFLVREGLLPEVPAGNEATWSITWQAAPATKVDLPLRNVVACLPGTDRKDEYVVVSAHYDHIGIGQPVAGDAIYNGADDDASGTTGVLLLAEALAKAPPLRRSVLFVCFSAEERGLRGSAAFVAEPPVPLASIRANLNLEMLGRPEAGKEGKAWITGADLSNFADLVTPALARAGVEVIPFAMAAQLFAASDNYSFVRQGIVAHSLSAGSLHRDYHRPSDELGKIDLEHMTKIIQGLYEAVRALADDDTVPAWNEKGLARLPRKPG